MDHQISDEKKCNFLKSSLQFVFSVSVLSFFVWYSCGFSMLPHDDDSFINAYFSTFLFSFFSHTLERKYMFLLCNAILAFLAKSSLMSTSSPSPSSSMPAFDVEASNLAETVAQSSSVCEEEEEEEEEEKKQDRCKDEYVSEGGEEQEDAGNIEVSEDDDEEEEEEEEEEVGMGGSDEVLVVTEEDEVDATIMAASEEVSNADELNRKFEEFIRKMKEEIRIEAQRQLIAV